MKRWPMIRYIRYVFHVWRYFFKFDPDAMPNPSKLAMDLEYMAGIKEGAW